jgi:hypothetical protein
MAVKTLKQKLVEMIAEISADIDDLDKNDTASDELDALNDDLNELASVLHVIETAGEEAGQAALRNLDPEVAFAILCADY